MALLPCQEFEKNVAERIGPLGLGQVAALRNDGDARLRHGLAEGLCGAHWQDLILLAPNDLGRDINSFHPLVQLGIVQARLPREPGESEAVFKQHFLLLGGGWHRQHALGNALIVKRVPNQLLGAPEKNVARHHAWRAKAGRVAVTITAATLRVRRLPAMSRVLTPSRSSIAMMLCCVKGELLRVSPVPFRPMIRP